MLREKLLNGICLFLVLLQLPHGRVSDPGFDQLQGPAWGFRLVLPVQGGGTGLMENIWEPGYGGDHKHLVSVLICPAPAFRNSVE